MLISINNNLSNAYLSLNNTKSVRTLSYYFHFDSVYVTYSSVHVFPTVTNTNKQRTTALVNYLGYVFGFVSQPTYMLRHK